MANSIRVHLRNYKFKVCTLVDFEVEFFRKRRLPLDLPIRGYPIRGKSWIHGRVVTDPRGQRGRAHASPATYISGPTQSFPPNFSEDTVGFSEA